MNVRSITPILNASDLAPSFAWFERLGWSKGWDRGESAGFGVVSVGEDVQLFLCHDAQGGRGRGDNDQTFGEGGSERADRGVRLSVFLDDVDALHARCRYEGLDVTFPPTGMPWGVRGLHVRHSDGHVFRMSQPLTRRSRRARRRVSSPASAVCPATASRPIRVPRERRSPSTRASNCTRWTTTRHPTGCHGSSCGRAPSARPIAGRARSSPSPDVSRSRTGFPDAFGTATRRGPPPLDPPLGRRSTPPPRSHDGGAEPPLLARGVESVTEPEASERIRNCRATSPVRRTPRTSRAGTR